MIKIKLLLFFILITTGLQAQEDFILIKKRYKTVERFTKGYFINCQLKNEQWVSGYIQQIKDDSIFIRPFQEQYYVNRWGLISIDTGYLDKWGFAVKDISAIPRKNQSLGFIKNGSFLQIGALGYAALNIINGIAYKEPLFKNGNQNKLAIAAGVFAAGKVLQWNYSTILRIGKKYRIEYIQLSPSS